MNITLRVPGSRSILAELLEALVRVNEILLRRRPYVPLYESGVRYQREPGREEWQTVEQLYKGRHGDCEDIGAARAAELRVSGIPARAIPVRTGKKTYHTVVELPNGIIEDPSVRLGMKRRR